MGNIYSCFSRTSSFSQIDQHDPPFSRHYYHRSHYNYFNRTPTDRTFTASTAIPFRSSDCGDPVHWPDITNASGWHYWRAVDPRPPDAGGTDFGSPSTDTADHSPAPVNRRTATPPLCSRSCSFSRLSSFWTPSTASEPTSPAYHHSRPRRRSSLSRPHSAPPNRNDCTSHTY